VREHAAVAALSEAVVRLLLKFNVFAVRYDLFTAHRSATAVDCQALNDVRLLQQCIPGRENDRTSEGSGGIAGFAKGSAAIGLVFDGEATMNAWFVAGGQPAPPKWKMFLVAWIAVYPILLCARRARPKFVATHSTRDQLSPPYVVSDLPDHAAFNQSAATVAAHRGETAR
jgi:hypothetical protein